MTLPAPAPTTAPAAPPARSPRSPVRSAAREVLDPAHLRTALQVRRLPGGLGDALRCGAAVAAALAACDLAGHREVAGFAALTAVTSVYGRDAAPRRRAWLLLAVGGLLAGSLLLASAAVALGAPGPLLLLLTAALAAAATAACALLRTGPPGATIIVFAVGAGLAGAPTLADLGPRAAGAAVGLAAAWLAAMSTVLTRPRERAALAAPPSPPSGAPPRPAWRLATVRVGLAGTVGAVASALAGLGHPAWAVMGSTAVLQGTSAGHTTVRALHRGLGTVAGALLAWPLLEARLGFVATCAVVVVLQTVTEVLVGRHYGLAMLTITPMALLMTTLAHGVDPTELATDRVGETAIGVLVGVVVAVLVHPPVRRRAAADAGAAPAGGDVTPPRTPASP